jgi:3-(3-hydroxy-phenyl)propionate hydroxylase
MAEHAVVVAGGGPTGMMLGGELALAGIDVAIVERRAGQGLPDALTTWFGPPTVA